MMNQDCYPFTFVHRSRNCGQGILYVDIYRFKSTKSNLVYLVRVERYEHNMYAVKFYQKNHRLSPKKYQILSNTFEARRIIYTCMNVMFHVYKENPRASFGFIGANCENESQENTKRYRVYNKIVATQVSENIFKHVENMGKSAYMLINRDELKEYPNLVEEIERTFQELYDYFD